MKEIIYTAIFVGLAILLVTLCFIMFRPKKDTAAVRRQPPMSRRIQRSPNLAARM